MPFDRRRKRRLLDSCGHERCLSCINKSDLCPLCVLTGSSPPKMSRLFPALKSLDPTKAPPQAATTTTEEATKSSVTVTTPATSTPVKGAPPVMKTPISPVCRHTEHSSPVCGHGVGDAANDAGDHNISSGLISVRPKSTACRKLEMPDEKPVEPDQKENVFNPPHKKTVQAAISPWSDSEKSRSGTPGLHLSLDTRESMFSSPFNLSLEEARMNNFRFLPRDSPLSSLLFRTDEDPANTSKESGFCSSESEAPGSLSGGGGLGRGGVGPPSHPHHSLRPQSRLVNASKYRSSPVLPPLESFSPFESLEESSLPSLTNSISFESQASLSTLTPLVSKKQPLLPAAILSQGPTSLPHGPTNYPQGPTILSQGPSSLNTSLYEDLGRSQMDLLPGYDSSGLDSATSSIRRKQRRDQQRPPINTIDLSDFSTAASDNDCATSGSERASSVKSSGKSSAGGGGSGGGFLSEKLKRKSWAEKDRHSALYKPFQKIYNFKAKFTEKKSGKAAQEKLSESYLAKLSDNKSSALALAAKHSELVLSDKSLAKLSKLQRDSDQVSEISTLYSVNSATLPRSAGSKLSHTFLKPLYFEVPVSFPVAEFTGRDWLYEEMYDQLASNEPTNRGIIVTGAPGTGKTAIILAMVERSCFGAAAKSVNKNTGILRSRSAGSFPPLPDASDYLSSLAETVVAYHFCQADNAITCRVPEFIHSMAAQISQSPQLAEYFRIIQGDPELRKLLSVAHCMTNPNKSLVSGVLEPLKSLKKRGKITGSMCIIVIDGLCEAEQHRPDFGDSIGNFLAKHLLKFPTWLKVVCTVRSQVYESARLLPFYRLCLDRTGQDDRLNKDMTAFISQRFIKSKLIRGNMSTKSGETESLDSFSQFLVNRAKGCFLYTKLVLDLVERGQLVLKSGSYKVIPRNLPEIYLLIFNIRFSSSLSYEKVADIFSICLASLQSISLAEVYRIYSSLSLHPTVSWREFRVRYNSIADLLVTRSDGSMMCFHPTLRDWLCMRRRDGESERFRVEMRTGHAAISFSISRNNTPMRPEKVLNLAHHVLKANLNKSIDSGAISCKDLQAAFLSLTTDELSLALASPRNIYNPVIKVSRLLLLSGASPDYPTEELEGAPLLGVHAALGSTLMVLLLIEFSADTNKTNNRGESPLHLAADQGHLEVVQSLLHYGAQMSLVSSAGLCPLVVAARNGHLQVVEILLLEDWCDDGEDEDDPQRPSREAAVNQALVAAAQYAHQQVCEFILDVPGVSVNHLDPLTGLTCLAAAAAAGCRPLVNLLVSQGARIEAATADGQTAVHLAARNGCWDIVDTFCREAASHEQQEGAGRGSGGGRGYGGAVNLRNKEGQTPLFQAVIGGHLGVVELLLERGGGGGVGVAVNGLDRAGLSPLHHAVAGQHTAVVRVLLAAGANPDHQDKQGRSALMVGVETGSVQLLEVLLEVKANMEICDNEGVRPLEKAISLEQADCVAAFLKRGAKLGSGTWNIAEGKPNIQMILINKILDDGNTLFRKNKLEDAAHRYKYALRRIPTLEVEWADTFARLESHLLLNLSRCQRRLGNHDRAVHYAQQVLDYEPESVEALVAKAKSLKAGGSKVEALATLRHAQLCQPNNKEINRAIHRLRYEVDESEEDVMAQLPAHLGSTPSLLIPFIDDSNCGSSITSA